MGFHRHHAVIVTGWNLDHLGEAHAKASEIYTRHLITDVADHTSSRCLPISDLIEGTTNGYASFTIVPDGSKEGWAESNRSNFARAEFIQWLRKTVYKYRSIDGQGHETGRIYLDWVELEFGGDDDEHAELLAHGGDDLEDNDEERP